MLSFPSKAGSNATRGISAGPGSARALNHSNSGSVLGGARGTAFREPPAAASRLQSLLSSLGANDGGDDDPAADGDWGDALNAAVVAARRRATAVAAASSFGTVEPPRASPATARGSSATLPPLSSNERSYGWGLDVVRSPRPPPPPVGPAALAALSEFDTAVSHAVAVRARHGATASVATAKQPARGRALRLPPELLVDIFSFLRHTSLCRCAAVSRRWEVMACSAQLWRGVARRLGLCPPPHSDARAAVRSAVLAHREAARNELETAEAALASAEARIERQRRRVAPFDASVLSEGEAPPIDVRRAIATAEARLTALQTKIDAHAAQSAALSREAAEAKAQTAEAQAALRAALSDVKRSDTADAHAERMQRLERRVVRAVLAPCVALPVVLRRGIESFDQLELLALQMPRGNNAGPEASGGERSPSSDDRRTDVVARWRAARSVFPRDETWFVLRRQLPRTPGEHALCELAAKLVDMSDAQLTQFLGL